MKRRIIKFHFWNKKDKCFLHTENSKCPPLCSDNTGQIQYWQHSKEDIIPLQWTGLKDKNGAEIYEGDIIEFKNCNKKYPNRVVWHEDECGFVLADSSDEAYFTRFSDVSELKIIGNIFENPELIK